MAPASMAPARQEPLYSDDCCEVHPDCVKIFWYFFPFAGTKTVQVSDLKCIHRTPETSLEYLDSKTWGMGFGKTWWACAPFDDVAIDRKAKGRAIVLEDSAWCRHGFSSRNRSAALAAIAQAIESQGFSLPHAPDLTTPPAPDLTTPHAPDLAAANTVI